MFIATDGRVTIVDNNDYNLTPIEAAQCLLNDQPVLAREYPDCSAEELYDMYPGPFLLEPTDFIGMTIEEIAEDIRGYDGFTVYS